MMCVVVYIILLLLILTFIYGATKENSEYDTYRGDNMKILDIKKLKFDDTNCKVFVTFLVDVGGKKCSVKRVYDKYSDLTKVLKDGYVEFQ